MSDIPSKTLRFIVLTGGPGAGKTAALEAVRRSFCPHVTVLPEAAGILFGGGFPRRRTSAARRAAQRAIFAIQRELERIEREEPRAELVLCDRGTLDGLAYWDGYADDYFHEVGTTMEAELARYATVIHLRTPTEGAYDQHNPLRVETAEEAAAIDTRIAAVWSRHPRVLTVDSSRDFMSKLRQVLALLVDELPPGCRAHMPADLSLG